MIESFLGICEIVNKKTGLQLPSVSRNQSKFKYYFLMVSEQYGADIFKEEFSINKDKFATILVDSRNRIAHTKSKQNRIYLDGGESVMYLLKLSLLYRVILFNLLGIPQKIYNDKLTMYVKKLTTTML